MPLIEWRKEFELGIPGVDYEHWELIGLINQAHAAVGEHDVSAMLGEIYAKIAAHFALEEKTMRERHYAELSVHKADHERLLEDIRKIMDEYENQRDYDAGELARRLDDWFTTHFKTLDARLHHFLEQD
jgi:hemerythrin